MENGDTSLQFYLSCDGGEKIAVDAAAGADHSFTAEKEIPLRNSGGYGNPAKRRYGVPFDLGETSVAGAVYPYFSGEFWAAIPG